MFARLNIHGVNYEVNKAKEMSVYVVVRCAGTVRFVCVCVLENKLITMFSDTTNFLAYFSLYICEREKWC